MTESDTVVKERESLDDRLYGKYGGRDRLTDNAVREIDSRFAEQFFYGEGHADTLSTRFSDFWFNSYPEGPKMSEEEFYEKLVEVDVASDVSDARELAPEIVSKLSFGDYRFDMSTKPDGRVEYYVWRS